MVISDTTLPVASAAYTSHITVVEGDDDFAPNDTFTIRKPKLSMGLNTHAIPAEALAVNRVVVLREAASRLPPMSVVVSMRTYAEFSTSCGEDNKKYERRKINQRGVK